MKIKTAQTVIHEVHVRRISLPLVLMTCIFGVAESRCPAVELNHLGGVTGYGPNYQYTFYDWTANGAYVTNDAAGYTGEQQYHVANLWNTNSIVELLGNTLVERLPDGSYGREWDGSGITGNFSQYGRARTNFTGGAGVAVDFTGNGYHVGAQPKTAWITDYTQSPSGTPGPSIFGIDLTTDNLLPAFSAAMLFSSGGTVYTNGSIVGIQVNPYTHNLYATYGLGSDYRCGYCVPGGVAEWTSSGTLVTNVFRYSPYNIALNPVNQHLLISDAGTIYEYDSSLNQLNTWQIQYSNHVWNAQSLTFDMDGHLYVGALNPSAPNPTYDDRVFRFSTTNGFFAPGDLLSVFDTPPDVNLYHPSGALVFNWQIPEPSSALLLGGALLLGVRMVRRDKKRPPFLLWIVAIGMCVVSSGLAVGPNELWGTVGYPQYSTYLWDANGNYLANPGIIYPNGQPAQSAALWNNGQIMQGFENVLISRNANGSYDQEWDGSGVVRAYNPGYYGYTNFNAGGLALEFTGKGYAVGAQPTTAWLSSYKHAPDGTPGPFIFGLNLASDTLLPSFFAGLIWTSGGTIYTNEGISQLQMNPYTHNLYASYGDNNYGCPGGGYCQGGGIAEWSTNGIMLAQTTQVPFAPWNMALDPVNQHILVAGSAYVYEYNSNLTLLAAFQLFDQNNQLQYPVSLTFDMDGHLFVSATQPPWTSYQIYEYSTTNPAFSTNDLLRTFWGAPANTAPGDLVFEWQIPEPSSALLLGGALLLGALMVRHHKKRLPSLLWIVAIGLCAVSSGFAASPNQLWGTVGYPQYSTYVWDANGNYLTNAGIQYPGGQPTQLANLWNTNTVLVGFQNTLITRNANFTYGQEYDGNGNLGTVTRPGFGESARGVGVDFTGTGYTFGAQPRTAWLTFADFNGSNVATNGYIRGLDLTTDTLLAPFNAEVSFVAGTTNRIPTAVQVNPYTHNLYVSYYNDVTVQPGGIAEWSTNGTLLAAHAVNYASGSIAIDPVNGHVLVEEGGNQGDIREFDSNLNQLGIFQVLNAQGQLQYANQLTFDMDGHLFVSVTAPPWTSYQIYEYSTANSTFSTNDVLRRFWGAPDITSPGDMVFNWQIPETSPIALCAFGLLALAALRQHKHIKQQRKS